MTVATIEKKARRLLQDTIEEYRWSSEQIRDSLVEAIRALNAIRPETRYVDGLLVDCIRLPDDDSATIDIEDRYEEALVYYVVHKCYLDDDSDTVNATLSADYLSKFNVKAQL